MQFYFAPWRALPAACTAAAAIDRYTLDTDSAVEVVEAEEALPD